MEQEDYSKIYEYESMGKEYAGEKACISLTSWKARINTVSKTLYSLVKMCPGFHIVLVLSKDEFPLKEKELPDNLMLFVENKLIELFWIKPNLKSFKKVLFTMDKYRDVPVISADDDCIYKFNYAQLLYEKWIKNKNCRISFEKVKRKFGQQLLCGYGTINPPNCFSFLKLKILENLIDMNLNEDDMFYAISSDRHKIKMIGLGYIGHEKICLFHDDISALSDIRKYNNKSDYYKMIKLKF